MTPPSATAEHRAVRGRSSDRRPARPRGRSAPARRHRRRRPRRMLYAGLGMVALGLLVAFMLPAAKREVVREFGLPLRYAPAIRAQAAQKHLPASLIAAVIYAETKFDPRTSPAGAEGPMQLEPATAEFLARRTDGTAFQVADLNHPGTNIAYGSYYLRYLLNVYHGSEVLALAAYNGGETNVDGWQAAALAHGHSLRISEIPFPQTRAYVAKVLHAEREYRRVYARQLGYG